MIQNRPTTPQTRSQTQEEPTPKASRPPPAHPSAGAGTPERLPVDRPRRDRPRPRAACPHDVTPTPVSRPTIEPMLELSEPQRVAQTAPVVRVLMVTEAVPAGFPSPAQDYFDGDIDLNEHLIRDRAATFVVRVAGDSMEGAGIWAGDELIVDRSLDPAEGDVVIAVVEGELTVKRLHLTGGGPELHPANSAYPVLHPRELTVWGVVTTCLHHLHR